MTRLSKPFTLSLLWLWAGAAIMFGAITAPALFNPNVLDNRELSGAIAGAILKRFFLASYYVLGACALISLLGWLADLKARRKMALLFALSLLLFGINMVQDQWIRTRLVRIKLEIKNAPDEKSRNRLRTQFSDWHEASVRLFGGALVVTLLGAGWVSLTDDDTRKSRGKPQA